MQLDLMTILSRYATQLIEVGRALANVPEAGYCEAKTISIWREFASAHGLPFCLMAQGSAPAITLGCFATAKTKIVVTADLDAVYHETEVVSTWQHLCGHHMQSVHAFGLALLYREGVFSEDVAIRLIGCPAEECQPAFLSDYPLPFVPGKRILLKEEAFANATAVLSTHAADNLPQRSIVLGKGTRGMIWMQLKRHTRSTSRLHTDVESWLQQELVSVLQQHMSANLASWRVRHLADAWDVVIATKNDRGHAPPDGGAFVQHLVESGIPAYLVADYPPLENDAWLKKRAHSTVLTKSSDVQVLVAGWLQGATDLGAVSALFPTLQVLIGGTTGVTHETAFQITDEWFSYVWPGSFLAHLIIDLDLQTERTNER